MTSDGVLVAEEPNPAVPQEVLKEVWQLKQEVSLEDIVSRLRARTVPSGYSFHPWKRGLQCTYNIDFIN